MTRKIDIEALCADKGLRITEQRKTIARVLGDSEDHPDVETLHSRAAAIDPNISIATVYRTVRLFEEAGILERHEFGDGRSRFEAASESHHDHLIDVETGKVVEFVDDELEACRSGSPRSSASAWSTTAWSCTASPSTANAKSAQPGLNARAIARIAGCLAAVRGGAAAASAQQAAVRPFAMAVPFSRRHRLDPRRPGRSAGTAARPAQPARRQPPQLVRYRAARRGPKSAFVAKDELGYGFLHWLADQNSTIYVSRSNRRGAKDQAVTIARALKRDQPVAVFPEGTTGPGTHLLPFRSTLLEAAHIAARQVRVRPVAIDYGDARDEVAWFEEPGRANVMRLLRRRGTIARHHPPARCARCESRPQED